MIYTTNSIESLNYQLRKIIKNRGHFPNDLAFIKLLWLAIRDIEDKRARQRAKEATNQQRATYTEDLTLIMVIARWVVTLCLTDGSFGSLSLV